MKCLYSNGDKYYLFTQILFLVKQHAVVYDQKHKGEDSVRQFYISLILLLTGH